MYAILQTLVLNFTVYVVFFLVRMIPLILTSYDMKVLGKSK
jgi:hypothetical protein